MSEKTRNLLIWALVLLSLLVQLYLETRHDNGARYIGRVTLASIVAYRVATLRNGKRD